MKHKTMIFINSVRFRLAIFFLRLFGYIGKDYAPLKCTCGSKELETCNQDYLDNWLVEFDCRCKKCGKILNHWAYGHWEI